MSKRDTAKNIKSKPIFLWIHSRKLLNQYFFKNKEYSEINTNLKLITGFILLLNILIFERNILVSFYKTLPKLKSFKVVLINLYSLAFFGLLKKKFRNAIFVIGDIDYPIYKALLISSSYFKNIDL